MTQAQTQQHSGQLGPETAIGWTALKVADIERMQEFYSSILGFQLIERQDRRAVLGVGTTPLLLLLEQSEAQHRPPRSTGLYHFAILVPTRLDLGRSLLQLATTRYPLDGGSDHLVSEALYLSDPEGNGIEIYRDRPRETWQWRDHTVQMTLDPLDYAGLLDEARRDQRPWQGLPEGTRIGHMHLQVADLQTAESFYHKLLGFDLVAQMPGALFVSAGGYHHHLGLNTWQSRGGVPAPARAVGLASFAIELGDTAELEALAGRLQAAGFDYTQEQGALVTHDPWRNRLVLTPRANSLALELAG